MGNIERLYGEQTRANVPPAVQVSKLTRQFGGPAILDALDLTVAPGEFVALLGRSGSGKTTLLRALSGLDEVPPNTVSVPERRAVVFQEPRLLPWRVVWRNVALGLHSADARDRALTALKEVGLEHRVDHWPLTLSGGEAQRASLARALVREPALLLLDEPFAALDALTRIKMHGLVTALCNAHNPAVLLVTHDVDEAILLADRALVLADGKIVAEHVINFPRPRRRDHPDFNDLRADLLGELGVSDADVAARSRPSTPRPGSRHRAIAGV